MKITKLQFYLITVAIILLPYSSEYLLFVNGQSTEAVVIGSSSDRTVCRYEVENAAYIIYAPLHYDKGTRLYIWYDPKDPKYFAFARLNLMLLSGGNVLYFVLLLVWLAFYHSFKK